MTENRKTLVFAGVAVVLALLAFLTAPSAPTPDEFADQGAAFFPDFTDPNVATSLEVMEIDEATGAPSAFKVAFENGRWVIPSHHNYPADAKLQLAQTAAGIIEIKRDDYRSDNIADYPALGVVDPGNSATSVGRGKRVTIRGEGGAVLADLIFGKEIEGRPSFRYVRHPDEKRVYASRVDINISTRFQDWIDPDLLQLTKTDIAQIDINDYSINERTRSVDRRGQIVLKNTAGAWTIGGGSTKVDSTTIQNMLATLDSLRIVGVRPKPEGISATLKQENDGVPLTNADLLSLQSKGFYLSREGQLMSNEGELIVRTHGGVIYTLRFGEVVVGSGLAITAGITDSTSGSTGGEQSQYLFVTTDYDRNVAGAEALSKQLNDRFADWYYVISHDSFTKLHKSRGDLTVAAKD